MRNGALELTIILFRIVLRTKPPWLVGVRQRVRSLDLDKASIEEVMLNLNACGS